jgi:hypothetical protein
MLRAAGIAVSIFLWFIKDEFFGRAGSFDAAGGVAGWDLHPELSNMPGAPKKTPTASGRALNNLLFDSRRVQK